MKFIRKIQTPEELEIVNKTKWFKEGGNILYFDKGGAAKKAIKELTLFPEIEEEAQRLLKIKNSEKAKKAAATKKANFEARPKFEKDYIADSKDLTKKQNQLSKDVEKVLKAIASGKFVPEIKWDPEEWLKTRKKMDQYDPSLKPGESYGEPFSPTNLKGYTLEDIEAFKSHIPELLAIEYRAKKDGTWMKNSNNSTYDGDPRVWLMWKLEGIKRSNPKTLWTFRGDDVSDFATADYSIWATSVPNIFADNYKRQWPFRTSTSGFDYYDANGQLCSAIQIDGKLKRTDDIVADSKSPFGVIIDNVDEATPAGALTNTDFAEKIVNDYILKDKHPRWFLHGNTGNFNIGFNKQGGNINYFVSGGTLETLVKALRDGFGGKKAVLKLAGLTGYGTDKKFLEAAAESYEKVCANLGGSVEEVMELYPMEELMEDVVKNMKAPEVTTKAAKGDYKKATVFAPKDADFTGTSLFGDSVDISKDIKELTKNGINETNKVSSNKPIREALNSQLIGFKSQPVSYSPSMEARESGYMGSKGSQVPVSVIRDAEVDEFKKQILVPTATERGASLDQAAYLTNHGTSGIIEKPTSSNLEQNLSTYADGYARLNASTVFNLKSGSRIKSLLIHENLGHGLEGFLSKDYLDSFKGLPGLNKLGERDAADVRAMLMEAKFFLWKQAKKVSGKDVISPAELNEFISKVPDSLLQELLATLNHQGVGAKGTGTTIALKFTQNPRQYKDMLGKMLGVGAVVGTGAAIASNSIPEAKQGMKFLEGGMIEEKPFYELIAEIPVYRHLLNHSIALEFDNDLSKLFASRKIKNGNLTTEGKRFLLKKYNLGLSQLDETLEDLYNAGLASSLFAGLEVKPAVEEFKAGGIIGKYSIGAAIKKFAGKGLSEVMPEATTKAVFGASGSTKVIGKATTEHLRKVAKATGDKRVEVLADFAEQCRDKGIKLPEEFNLYVDAIFKTPTKVSSDTKRTRVAKEITADPEIVEYKGITVERPTFEKTKYRTKVIHTGEFKDKLEFKRTIPKTEEELKELSPKIDEALSSLSKMMNGEEFLLSEKMMDEIYLKSKGRILNFADNKSNTSKLRRLFNEVEYPTLVKRQLSPGYIHPKTDNPELLKFYDASKNNIEWFSRISDQVGEYAYGQGIPGEVKITPLRIAPKDKELAVYTHKNDGVSFLPLHTMTKHLNPYVRSYRFTVDGKPVKGAPTFNFEEHHSNALALMLAEAYIANPNPKSAMEHVRDYLKNRMKDGTKDSYYDLFLVLNKPEHTGIGGIHHRDKLSLLDLLRIKALSRSGRFKSMDDLLLYYFNKIKAPQLKYLAAKQGTKLIPKVSKITGESDNLTLLNLEFSK